MAPQQKLTPNFRRVVYTASQGTVLKPLLLAYLLAERLPDRHEVVFERTTHREPDGWFHPSTHPLWPERKLYWYLAEPKKMVPEPLGVQGMLSVTIGSAVHSLMETCLHDMGVMEGTEVSVVDEECGSRGHCDGIASLEIPGFERVLYELKTSNNMTLGGFTDLDLDAYKEKWPYYYAQLQEYMRMLGLKMAVTLFIGLGYPWEVREFHVPYDESFALSIRAKYLRVRKMVAEGTLPPPCCFPGSADARGCVARAVCPVARA
jgi:hypothetical protein